MNAYYINCPNKQQWITIKRFRSLLSFVRRPLSVFYCLLSIIPSTLFAQNIHTSTEKNLGVEAQGYTFSGKINDRILFLYWTKNRIEVEAFDLDLHKQWDRTIDLDKKFSHNVIDVICSKTDFTIIEYAERRSVQYLKVWKYDSQIKLLDSATIKSTPKNYDLPTPKLTLSEDKKVALISEKEEGKFYDLFAFSLDSLKLIWEKLYDYKRYISEGKPEQYVVSNQADVFLALEENPDSKKTHQYRLVHFNAYGNPTDINVPIRDFYVLHTKFNFDNFNQKLCIAGIYSEKNISHAQGLFTLNVSTGHHVSDIVVNIFDDDFTSAFMGKKITNTRGLTPDLRVQDIVLRRDGGMLLIVEQVREVLRVSSNPSSFGLSHRDIAITDYYHDNAFLANIAPDGKMQWRSVVVKKQSSQNDEGRFCSFFVLKTSSAIHLLFNEDVGRSTTVSDYLFKPDGQPERHTILNTDGKNLQLRFRDALQIGANELLVPSQENLYVKMVKIEL